MADLVTVTPLKLNVDDRGTLVELLRADEPDAKLGQVYAVTSFSKGTIRGLHSHDELWDYFVVLLGSAKFRFFNEAGEEQIVVVSSQKLCRLNCPPKIAHGWMALEDNTILISIASEPYMGYGRAGKLDEHRMPYNKFDGDSDGWAVLPR